MSINDHIERLRARNFPWPIAFEIVEAMCRREGFSTVAYLCPAKVPTIGWGETVGIKLGDRWTEDRCDTALFVSVREYAAKVEDMCTTTPNENQLGAMTSLSYNIGLGAFSTSTVLKCHNRNDFAGAARAFSLFNKARGRDGKLAELPGLTSRRVMEAAIYAKEPDGAPFDRMPQAVSPEGNLAASPIAASGAVVAASGVLSGIASAQEQLGAVSVFVINAKELIVGVMGVPEAMFTPTIMVAAGVVAVAWRYLQRKGGWA
jgi:lysozyme